MSTVSLLKRPVQFAKRQYLKYLEWRAPTVLHITHWKAGSQWLYVILKRCCPERIVAPKFATGHVLNDPVLPGKIYPTVYATAQQLQAVTLPKDTRRFVILRDLRDTLISLYFSAKTSHGNDPSISRIRPLLNSCSEEEGLVFLMNEALPDHVGIQMSWINGTDPVVRYEDLLENDETILADILLGHCRLPILRQNFLNVVRSSRFQNLSKGRPRGQEDTSAHWRKGVAGDWHNHFTPAVTRAFKEKYGHVLIATGYERDLSWQAQAPRLAQAS